MLIRNHRLHGKKRCWRSHKGAPMRSLRQSLDRRQGTHWEALIAETWNPNVDESGSGGAGMPTEVVRATSSVLRWRLRLRVLVEA